MISVVWIAVLLLLAGIDIFSANKKHKDFRGSIILLGALGALVVIAVEISDALSFAEMNALCILIVAMGLGAIVGIYQRVFQKERVENLSDNNDLKEAITALKEANLKIAESNEILANEFKNALDSALEKHFEKNTNALKSIDSAILTNQEKFIEQTNALDSAIKEMDFNLKKELERLSANFSADVISGVEALANKYQNSIEVHFSENFKRFNSAVENLLVWQDEYRQSVLNSNEILKHSAENLAKFSALTNSILARDEKIIALHREVSVIMERYKAQNANLDEKLNAVNNVGSGAIEALKIMGEFFAQLSARLNGVLAEFDSANQKIIADLGKRDGAVQMQLAKNIKILDELIKSALNHNKSLNESYAKLNKDVELHSKAISKNTSEMISAINKDGIKHLKNTTKLYFEDISTTQKNILEQMSAQIDSHYKNLDSMLVAMSAKYLESLEQISISSVNASKDLNLINAEGVRNLNDEIAKYVRQNSDMLKTSSAELVEILAVLQRQIDSALSRTDKMQSTTQDFMADLESSLRNASEGFKNDYEWFLRRVKEIIGARG
ncbi:hypothetical protein ACWIUD_11565 [Helicobacter sp. 23-1044]